MTVSVEQIADELRGTCQPLHVVLERHDMEDADKDSQFCHDLDSRIFECNFCNWWWDHSEMSEEHDWICEDCARDC